MDLDIREELLARRKRLQAALARKSEAREQGLVEMVDELSVYDQHPGDISSELFEREKDAGLEENLEVELTKVNEALERLGKGTYGICERCGKPIDARRLRALPEANLCFECVQSMQDEFTRPDEERQTDMEEINEKGEWFKVAEYDLFEEWHKKFQD